MSYNYSATYLACQTCHAKVHCDDCAAKLEEAIMRIDDVRGVSLNIVKKELMIDADTNEDDLLDALEALGLFAD